LINPPFVAKLPIGLMVANCSLRVPVCFPCDFQ
jgi:hypothetical protein